MRQNMLCPCSSCLPPAAAFSTSSHFNILPQANRGREAEGGGARLRDSGCACVCVCVCECICLGNFTLRFRFNKFNKFLGIICGHDLTAKSRETRNAQRATRDAKPNEMRCISRDGGNTGGCSTVDVVARLLLLLCCCCCSSAQSASAAATASATGSAKHSHGKNSRCQKRCRPPPAHCPWRALIYDASDVHSGANVICKVVNSLI